ncbi:uncharacterized protein EI90DRAFT_3052451 [Cantharellus anzutake]|uniref:uncharacterized protein n=1 Tax=Cantharellus anzutake TaxID=1750568 RepID=UPI0019047D84|nr:uncharacterized protein EI90DRAFT_3052451 [Cantharellus anzutake]KAF8333578.1 hypothetical protein EI90DRAFT_3052451 [Cantharellus anzutake]
MFRAVLAKLNGRVWGVMISVCASASACQNGYSSVFGNSTSTDPGLNGTIVCNTASRVYTAGEMSCRVQNPTLQNLFPLSSVLNILRTYNSSQALAPNLTSYGPSGTLYAQFMYDGVEQFYCRASGCTQTSDQLSSKWSCPTLDCTCRPQTLLCDNSLANLSTVINGLPGPLSINCNGNSSCNFQQTLLTNLFGPSGLPLSSCTFGECVRQGVIDAASGSPGPATKPADGGAGLSGGVIAGIAVVGALLFAAIALYIVGWINQRRARLQGSPDGGAVLETRRPGTSPGGVGMQWQNLSFSVPSRSSFILGRDSLDPKFILNGVSGNVKPGSMLAVLGPSGAGKTTLVDILSKQNKRGAAFGTVSFFGTDSAYDGRTFEPADVQPRIAYVDQADVLPASQTVFEALLFVARLRLPESVTDSEKKSRAMEVMRQLGLDSVADSRIGDRSRRGLSGGEMRRVSIGIELIGRPDILILDEPTSGLDSASAYKVAALLRDLSRDTSHPMAVIASIHQPSSHLYQTFDSVLVLGLGGRQLYFGPGGSSPVDTLAEQGYVNCPTGYSIPDHLLDLASDVEHHSTSAIASKPEVAEVGKAESHGATELGTSPMSSIMFAGNDPWWKSGSYPTAFLTQFEVLCAREWKNLLRDKSLFLLHIAAASILGVFCGALYFQTKTTIAGFQSRVGCLFFLGSLLAFSSLSALFNLVEIGPLFKRERASKLYSPTAWLLSRILFDIVPLRVVPTIIVSTIVYWMAGLSPHVDQFFKYLLVLVLFSLAMTLFNFLLAAIFRNGGIAILLSAIWNLFLMTYAGFFVHLSSIPPVLRWLQYFSLLKYCLEALAVNEFNSGLTITDVLQGVPVSVSAVVIMQLLFGFKIDSYYRDVLVLFAFLAGFSGLLFLVIILWFRERR